MEPLKKVAVLLMFLFFTATNYAQRVKLTEGKLPDFGANPTIFTELTFENTRVGKFDKEADYVKSRTDEYNKKEAGKGDSWAEKWEEDKNSRYESKFNETLILYSGLTLDNKSQYTLIFNTTFIEPGFNIGITRKSASINGEVLIVETANKNHVIAKLSVDKAPGSGMWGSDFDTGERISESYATAGRAIGKFIKGK